MPLEEIDPDEEIETSAALTNPRVSLSNGDWIKDRYQLMQPLGDGVLGATWRARDSTGGADVAVKLVGGQLLLNDGERRDFSSKLEMFARRTLAGCVMPVDVVPSAGCVAVVTPFVDAVSLRAVMTARCEAQRPFTVEESLRVLLSLVGALQALHTASPHGLLRPENVMISARGLLLTGGILGVCLPPDRVYELLRQRAPRAVAYVAPELAAGRRPTASADLYALGAIATELVGGVTPDQGPNLGVVSRELHRAVATLLDREPGRRPAGVRLLLDALTQAAGFSSRPMEPPLPVAESVGAVWSGVLPAVSVLPAAGRAAVPEVTLERAGASRGSNGLAPYAMADRTEAVACVPEALEVPVAPEALTRVVADPGLRIGPSPGRLGVSTASLPLPSGRGVHSGPPPELRVRSGPPGQASETDRARGLGVELRRGAHDEPETSVKGKASERSMNDDDGIDPRLLRAARLLDAERRKDWAEETQEFERAEEG